MGDGTVHYGIIFKCFQLYTPILSNTSLYPTDAAILYNILHSVSKLSKKLYSVDKKGVFHNVHGCSK